MKKIRKTLAVCLTASVLAASSAVSASAAAFSDVSGHWAEPTINQWVDRGYINGYPDGTFRPNHPITRTEFALVINRAFHFQNTSAIYFPDVSQTFWGYGEIQKAYAAGYMKGDANGTFRPNANVTRQEAAIVLANIKGLSFSGSAPYYSDSNSISSWARGSVNAVSAAGYMSGYPNGTFAPRDSLTRAQAVTMLNKAMNTGGTTTNPYVPPAQSTTDSVQNMTLQNTTLRNTIVNGDLTIPSSMSSRSITLDNVTVRGKLNLEGGGTITAEDCVINELVMDKSSAVFRAEDGTSVAKTTFRANGTLEGDRFQDVSVANSKVNTVTIDAEVENLTLDTDADMRLYGGAEIETFEITKNADDALIELSRGARVRNMNIRDGVRIAGDGDIDNMTVYVSGVRSEIEPDSLSRRSGAGKPDFDWEYNGKRHESSGSSSSSSSSSSRTISRDFDGNGATYRNVTVTDDALVKDMRVTGNLTIDKDVENGTVTLKDVRVDGNVYVYGGGSNSVVFRNCDIRGDIISDKDSSASRSQIVALRFDSSTEVRGEIRIQNDTILDVYSGSPELNNVVVEERNVRLDADIDIDTLTLEERAKVNVGNGVTIDTLKTNRGIGESTIDMDGSSVIKTVDARSDVDIRGTGTVNKINKDSGVNVTLGSGIKNEPEQPSKPGSVTSVTLDKTTASVEVGKTTTLKATVATPDSGTDKTVTWTTSDKDTATVSDTGVVTGVKEGKAKITATSKADTTKSATCTVTVGTLPDPDDPDAPVTVPTLSPAAMSVQVGAKATLTLKLPEKFEDYQAIDWAVSGDASTVVLDEAQGPAETVRKLSALKAGKATVTATIKKSAGGAAIASASCDITVTANSSGTAALQGVSIGRSINGQAVTGVNIKVGTDTNQLVALLNPSNAGYSSIMWNSDDPTVVEPNMKDLTNIKSTYLNAKKQGTAIITLTVMPENADENTPAKTATCEVTVSETGEPIAVTGLTVSPSALSLQVGSATNATGKFTATVAPANATNKAVVWSSNKEDVATVSQDGTVTAVGAGTAIISAKTTDGGFERACTVTVAGSTPTTGITLKYDGKDIPTGGIEVTAGEPGKKLTSPGKTVTFASGNTNIVTVAPDGTVTGVHVGTGTITATDGTDTETVQVKVNPKVVITEVAPANATAVPIPDGEVRFTYAVTGLEDASDATVTAKIKDEKGQEVVGTHWELDPSDPVVIVSSENPGVYTLEITAEWTMENKKYSGTTSGQYTIVPTLELGQKNFAIAQNSKMQLPLTVNPATGYRITDISIHNYNQAGNVPSGINGAGDKTVDIEAFQDSPIGVYSLSVTIECNGQTATDSTFFEVTGGSASQETTVAINPLELELTLEDGKTVTGQLSAAVTPLATASQGVTWSVKNGSETFVSVDQNGLVTAKAAGSAIIVATSNADSTKFAECYVTVKAANLPTISVENVGLNKTTLSLDVGAKEKLTATVSPADATNKTVTWSTSNSAIATVQDGMVTAVAPGTATITATTADGKKTANCAVTVKPTITIIERGFTIKQGETKKINVEGSLPTGYRIETGVKPKDDTSTSGDDQIDTMAMGNTGIQITAKAGTPTKVYTLTVKRFDGDAQTPTASDSVEFEVVANDTAKIESVTLKHNNADIPESGIELEVNGTATLTATVTPSTASQEVTWSVKAGGESIVSVNQNGLVTAKAEGTATVVATSDADSTKSAECIVTVKLDSSGGQVTQLTLSSEKLDLVWDDGSTNAPKLIATLPQTMQSEKITWKVTTNTPAGAGNDDVIMVYPEETSSGEQTTVMMTAGTDVGTATITATAGGQSATCEVTVKPFLRINTKDAKFPQGGVENSLINFVVAPTKNPPKVEIKITKADETVDEDKMPKVGTISGGIFPVLVPEKAPVGKYTLEITATRNGLVSTDTVTFEVIPKSNNAAQSVELNQSEADSAKATALSQNTAQTVQKAAPSSNAAEQAVTQNTVQTVQQQSAPRTFSFIPQRELQSKPTAPVVTVEPEQKQEAVKEPEKEPEKVQEPEKEQEPVKEPETAQEPEKTPEEVQEPEKTPEQTQGIALTCADSFKAGETLTLSGTVNGVSGALRKIEWSIRDAGATGAAIRDGVMSAEQAGTVTVAATVQNSTTTEIFTITVLPGDEPKADEPIAQEPAETEPQTPVPGVQPETPAEGQAPAVTAPAVQTGAVTLPNGQVIPNAKKYQRSVGTIIALSGLDALPANAVADSVVWKAESLGTTGAALQMQDNTLVSVNANTAGVILLSRTVKVTNADGSAAIMTTYYEITVA